MEIERKFLISQLPGDLASYPSLQIEQGYLCVDPVVRIRRQNDSYILTYKSSGMLEREEYNLPLTREAYLHLRPKADGCLITKRRYRIPFGAHTIELDIFEGAHQGLVLAEVEFASRQEALSFSPPSWFCEDVTFDPRYHNSYLAFHTAP